MGEPTSTRNCILPTPCESLRLCGPSPSGHLDCSHGRPRASDPAKAHPLLIAETLRKSGAEILSHYVLGYVVTQRMVTATLPWGLTERVRVSSPTTAVALRRSSEEMLDESVSLKGVSETQRAGPACSRGLLGPSGDGRGEHPDCVRTGLAAHWTLSATGLGLQGESCRHIGPLNHSPLVAADDSPLCVSHCLASLLTSATFLLLKQRRGAKYP